ncbi:MAG: YggS family pyridoxal phosphate-dependent enzyme [Solirubrobacteraceae bacterium]|jgi:pyridoxal phosphate enzyme (YggS family)
MAALSVERVRANLAHVRGEIAAAAERVGRDPDGVELLAAVKYLSGPDLEILADGGVTLVGENRAQALLEKVGYAKGRLHWHFIGTLQSRKVKLIAPHVELIHSVASESVLRELGRHAPATLAILIEVNLSGEPGKAGIDPSQLDEFIALSPVHVAGLMTMPPQTEEPERSRPYFEQLAALARERGLEHVSAGTSQDYTVAVESGATIVRIGTSLYR